MQILGYIIGFILILAVIFIPICLVAFGVPFLLILLLLCFVPCWHSLIGKQMVTGVLKLPYTVVFAPFMYMLAEIIVRTCINIRNAFKEYKEGGKES